MNIDSFLSTLARYQIGNLSSNWHLQLLPTLYACDIICTHDARHRSLVLPTPVYAVPYWTKGLEIHDGIETEFTFSIITLCQMDTMCALELVTCSCVFSPRSESPAVNSSSHSTLSL
jgi:hypothetical protein